MLSETLYISPSTDCTMSQGQRTELYGRKTRTAPILLVDSARTGDNSVHQVPIARRSVYIYAPGMYALFPYCVPDMCMVAFMRVTGFRLPYIPGTHYYYLESGLGACSIAESEIVCNLFRRCKPHGPLAQVLASLPYIVQCNTVVL